VEPPGQRAEIFGMAGVTDPGTVQRLLVDRVRDDRRRSARLHLGDSAVDGADDEPCIGRAWSPRLGEAFAADWQNRQRVGKYLGRVSRRRDRPYRYRPTKPRRQSREPVRIVDHIKQRYAVTAPQPGLQRDLAADPGRLAHRQGERQGHAPPALTST